MKSDMDKGHPGNVSLPMSSSLVQWIARDILERCPEGRDFSRVVVVFPGRRPSLYLRRELGRLVGGAYTPPRIFDIDSFMAYLASRTQQGMARSDATPAECLQLMYETAAAVAGRGPHASLSFVGSGFESFFPWGLKLIEIFDEFGTELVPATWIAKAVPTALNDSGIGETAHGIWPLLPELYAEWQKGLGERSLWTRGELYRAAAEGIEALTLIFPMVYLAGFVALTRAEEEVFSCLSREGAARVVVQAGLCFGTQNPGWAQVERLKGICSGPWHEVRDVPESGAFPREKFRLHEAVDLHSQLVMAAGVFSGSREEGGRFLPEHRAIVLPEPNSLVPVLSWLVEDAAMPYNISLGYPLHRTNCARLVLSVLEAQEGRDGEEYHVPQYKAVLMHPYLKNIKPEPDRTGPPQHDSHERRPIYDIEQWIEEERRQFIRPGDVEEVISAAEGPSGPCSCLLKDIHNWAFRRLEQTDSIGGFASALLDFLNWILGKAPFVVRYPLEVEFLTAMAGLLEDLASSSLAREAISAAGFRLLLRHLIRQQRIPFRGTPLSGLQVLGFLETRCLNFRQVTIFDLNEGILPPEIRPDPFLPPDLRRHLGLPDRRKTADISRYHLFRLLAGAEEVHLFFSEGGGKTRSRFVEEIVWGAEKEACRRNVIPVRRPVGSIQPPNLEPEPIAKSPEVQQFLRGLAYSATAVDTYLWCPFRFYARYVLGLGEAGTGDSDEFDPVTVGITVHRILNEFYRPWVDRRIVFPEYCERVLEDIADLCLREKFGPAEHWSGGLRLFREVLLYRMNQFLRLERGYAEGRFLMGLEVACQVSLDVGSEITIHGTPDRVEKDQDGTVWVLDYKTGGAVRLPQGVSGLSDRRSVKRVMPSLQLPIYLLMCDRRYGLRGDWSVMNAALYGLKGLLQSSTVKDLITPLFKVGDDRHDLVDRCYVPALKVLFREILDPAVPFVHDTSDPGYCASCPYVRGLCRAV